MRGFQSWDGEGSRGLPGQEERNPVFDLHYPKAETPGRRKTNARSLLGALDGTIYNSAMLDWAKIGEILQPFRLELSPRQLSQIQAYLELLLRWNRRINLTSLKNEEECLTRHFGESLFAAGTNKLEGNLVDVGSGAGFPGLALKIAFPELSVTLLEPAGKKRAFLKEAARACGMSQVEVRSERLEEFAPGAAGRFDVATMRALGQVSESVRLLVPCLKKNGLMVLWLGQGQIAGLSDTALKWQDPVPIPLSTNRVILAGRGPS